MPVCVLCVTLLFLEPGKMTGTGYIRGFLERHDCKRAAVAELLQTDKMSRI